MKIVFTIAFALALSILAGLSSMASAYQSTAPAVALSVFPWNGFAYASAANRGIAAVAAAPKGEQDPTQLASIEKSARQAFILEPLAADAIRTLGLVADYENDAAAAQKMMRNAALLTRRDISTNLWLIGDYGKLNDTDRVLALSDQSLRTSSQAQAILLPALRQSLENSENIDPMVSILSKAPPWEREFWVLIKDHPESFLNAALVRRKLRAEKVNLDPQIDQNLITYLIDAGQFGAAEKLFLVASKNFSGKNTDLLRNGDFTLDPDLTPFAWETFFDSDSDSEIDAVNGQLVMTVFPNGSGVMARQMLDLPAGRFRLKAKLDEFQLGSSNILYIKLECVDSNAQGGGAARINIDADKVNEMFENNSNCRWFWLSVLARPSQNSESMTFKLDTVVIDRES